MRCVYSRELHLTVFTLISEFRRLLHSHLITMTTAFIPLSPPKGPDADESLMGSLDIVSKPIGTVKGNTTVNSSLISPLSESTDSPIDEPSLTESIDASSVGQDRTTSAASTKLQTLIKEKEGLIVCPGVYDGLSARVALQVGFDALYMVRTFRMTVRFAKPVLTWKMSRLAQAPRFLAWESQILGLHSLRTCETMLR